MSATTQHEFHPDAESLNAFAEQALSERERSQVLKHLTVCARCRQVVTLAHDAADLKIEAPVAHAAPSGTRIQPDAWWKQWRIVWVPATIAIALAVTSFSAYMRYTERKEESIKIAEQTPTRPPMPAPLSSPPEQAKPAPQPAPDHGKPTPRAATSTQKPGPRPASPPPAPEPPAQQAEASPPAAPPAPENAPPPGIGEPAPQQGAMMHQHTADEPSEGRSSTAYKAIPSAASAARQKQAEERQKADKQEAEIDAKQRHIFARENHGEQMAASSQPPDSTAAPRPVLPMPSGTIQEPDGGVKRIYLPSGMRIESMASVGHRMLTVDTAGNVFLSDDGGETWAPVNPQWTGRAVKIRLRTEISATEAAPAVPDSPSVGMAAASAHSEFFELLNDQGQVWLSTDGKNWVAK